MIHNVNTSLDLKLFFDEKYTESYILLLDKIFNKFENKPSRIIYNLGSTCLQLDSTSD